jgi:hypothetical protein
MIGYLNSSFIKRLLSLCLAASLPHIAAAAVDLTPRYIDTFSDGVAFHRLYFTDGDRKIVLSLNHETEAAAESGGTMFRFRKLPETTFLVLRSRLSTDDHFEGAALERYRESARRCVPAHAVGVAIKEEQLFPYPINDWKSYRITLSFDLDHVHRFQCVTFLNLNANDQIMLITTAPESNFGEAMSRSHQIIRTWQEMLPGDEKPATSN